MAVSMCLRCENQVFELKQASVQGARTSCILYNVLYVAGWLE